MKKISTYLFAIFCTCFAQKNVHAQNSPQPWFHPMLERIERNDTIQLLSSITVHINSNDKSESNEGKLALADFYSTLSDLPKIDSAVKMIDATWELTYPDSLQALYNYIHGADRYVDDDYPKALQYFNTAATLFQNKAADLTQARCFVLRGIIFQSLDYGDDAQRSFRIALDYYLEAKVPRKIAACYNNMALAYKDMNDSSNASRSLFLSLNIRDSIGDIAGEGQSYTNLGSLMYDLHHYGKALEYYETGLKFRTDGHAPKKGIIESHIFIGKTLYKLGKTDQALKELLVGFNEAHMETSNAELTRRAAEDLANIYRDKKDFKNAYDMQSLFYVLQDSLYRRSKKEDIVKQSVQYTFHIQQMQDSLQRVEKDKAAKAVQEEKDKRTNLVLFGLIAGLLLTGFVVFNLYRSNADKKKKNEIISRQRDVLDKKQKEITDSIQYARRIQRSSLPQEKIVDRNLDRMKKGS